jgi:SPP1 gp7 family putative phage head morphogenesis protein
MIQSLLQDEELSTMDSFRLRLLLDQIEEFAESLYADLEEKILDDLEDLANQESDWATSMLSRYFDEITDISRLDTQLAVFGGVLSLLGGKRLREATETFRRSKVRQNIQAVRDGVTLREPNKEIIQRIRSLNPLHKKQAGSLIRTMNNHVSVKTRDLALKENIGLFDGYEWISVLDSRTSIICASRDGVVYPFGDDPIISPKPPAHFSCRSTITPKVKPEFEDRVKTPARRTATGAKGKTKVNQSTTYESWLRRQPKDFVDDVLGRTRGALFRRGKLPISKFVDESGKTLTLDELRKVEPEVFNRVKL